MREVGPWDLVETVREGLLVLDSDLTKTDTVCKILPTERAITIGLIVNELVTNAVKYGFPADAKGTVLVTLERARGEFCLTVADNGQGIDPRRADSGLGGRLVEGVAQQLGGRLKRESGDKGTIVCLTLPLREASYDRDREGLP